MAVPRESQIDAVELDSECSKLFETQLSQAIAHLPAASFLKWIEPEISALLNLAVYVVPLYTNSTLIGHQLLAIEFTDGKIAGRVPRKWYIYGFILVGIKWLTQRWHDITSRLLNQSASEVANEQVLNYVQISGQILSLVNSLIFLKQGLYPTILHRVLKLRTQLVDPNEPRSSDLTTLTRELLWHSFAETLMFALPLVNIHRVKRWFYKLNNSFLGENRPGVKSSKNSLCAVCNEVPTLAQETECHHIFCYYCLKANLAACPDYNCPLCDSLIVDEQ